ncbi:hypothetical protein [Rhizobium sp. L1K21]|uniref:hypothetical protein n=1 Tax=Rhizobium sp. L1K21 TaxID=2954933 RepID=UPI0020931601|nr:hypothetical protein [Rhizobium sp. L1K21]MCO6185158.1 hypothetical protein [Rhizobium sp. L1K21]
MGMDNPDGQYQDIEVNRASTNERRAGVPSQVRPVLSSESNSCCETQPPRYKNLPVVVDDAILKIARALARQAARKDHARQQAGSAYYVETRRNLRKILDRSTK